MFEHDDIQKFTFSEVPLNQDIYLMGEEWLDLYEKSIIGFLNDSADYENVGYISYVAARTINEQSIEISWYPNVHDRFHEVRVLLPRSAFVMCVGSWTIDEKPRVFVKTEWLNQLHMRSYSLFAMVDAIGVKAALLNGSFTHDRLVELQSKIDEIAARYPEIAFVSFADSVFLKMNWTVGTWNSETSYSYKPEKILRPLIEINDAYESALSMKTYAILTQGSNEFYAEDLIHISTTQNHISLNSLGLPFAQIFAIDTAARSAIRGKEHSPSEIYMDQNFFRSLKLKHNFNKSTVDSATYVAPLAADPQKYLMMSRDDLMDKLA